MMHHHDQIRESVRRCIRRTHRLAMERGDSVGHVRLCQGQVGYIFMFSISLNPTRCVRCIWYTSLGYGCSAVVDLTR